MFEENTYILWDETTKECAIVDPGMKAQREIDDLDGFISNEELKVKMILLTHAHLDHTFGLDHVKEVYGVEVLGHKGDEPLLQRRDAQARQFHIPVELKPLKIDRYISDDEVLKLGEQEIKAINVPGHSEGSLAYYVAASGFILTGDVLFRSGIGRTDLPGGSMTKLIRSIKEKLFTLPPKTIVFPGHGDYTTIEAEKRNFPY